MAGAEDRVYLDLEAKDNVSRPARAAAASIDNLGKQSDEAKKKFDQLDKSWKELSGSLDSLGRSLASDAFRSVLGLAAAGGVAVAGTFYAATQASERLKGQVEALGAASTTTLKALGDAVAAGAAWQTFVGESSKALRGFGKSLDENRVEVDKLVRDAMIPMIEAAALAAPAVGSVAGALLLLEQATVTWFHAMKVASGGLNWASLGTAGLQAAGGNVFGAAGTIFGSGAGAGVGALGLDVAGGAKGLTAEAQRWERTVGMIGSLGTASERVSKMLEELAAKMGGSAGSYSQRDAEARGEAGFGTVLSDEEPSYGWGTVRAPRGYVRGGGGRGKSGGKSGAGEYGAWPSPAYTQTYSDIAAPMRGLDADPSVRLFHAQAEAAREAQAKEEAARQKMLDQEQAWQNQLAQSASSSAIGLGQVAIQSMIAGEGLRTMTASMMQAVGRGITGISSSLVSQGGAASALGVFGMLAGTAIEAIGQSEAERERKRSMRNAGKDWSQTNPLPVHIVRNDAVQVVQITQFLSNSNQRSTAVQGAATARAELAARRAGMA